MASRVRICLTVLLAIHLPSVLSESKPIHTDGKEKTAPNNKDVESIIEQETSQAIKKLEKQFRSTFMAYTSTKDQGKRKQAHEKLEHLVNVVKRESKANLEKSVKGFHFDVQRLSDKETQNALEASYIRGKRSKSWGSCDPVCKQRCLPTCNLVCCIAPPYNVPRETAKILEKQLGSKSAKKKSTIKKHTQKTKSTIKEEIEKKTSTAKNDKKRGGVCEAKCQKLCLPSCEFRCCIAPKKTKH